MHCSCQNSWSVSHHHLHSFYHRLALMTKLTSQSFFSRGSPLRPSSFLLFQAPARQGKPLPRKCQLLGDFDAFRRLRRKYLWYPGYEVVTVTVDLVWNIFPPLNKSKWLGSLTQEVVFYEKSQLLYRTWNGKILVFWIHDPIKKPVAYKGWLDMEVS